MVDYMRHRLRAPIVVLVLYTLFIVSSTRPLHHDLDDIPFEFARRHLLQCSCPPTNQAISTCSALPSSSQASIRNTLIQNCGANGPITPTSSCCSAIPTSQWPDFLNCLCAGDSVIEGISAFVATNEVVTACGCASGSDSSIPLGRSGGGNNQDSASSLPPPPPPVPAPANDTGDSPDTSPSPQTNSGGPTIDPTVIAQILAGSG